MLVQSVSFTSDGQSFLLAGKTGFIEVWDTESVKAKMDLEYQQLGNYMNQGTSVLSLTISKDNDHIAIGSDNGQLKIWKISQGQVVKVLPLAHRDGILSVMYNKDSTQVLTASMDMTARIQGLKSGKTLKEFRGHSSFVNSALYTRDNSQVITASSDGTVRMWDAKTTECLNSIRFRPSQISLLLKLISLLCFRPGSLASEIELIEVAVRKVLPVPNQPDQTLVCMRQSKAVLISNLTGQVLQVYNAAKKTGCDFISVAFSSQGNLSRLKHSLSLLTAVYVSLGKWVYCASEDKNLYIFDTKTGQLEETMTIDTDSEIIDIIHHPQRNLLAVLTRDGQVSLATP